MVPSIKLAAVCKTGEEASLLGKLAYLSLSFLHSSSKRAISCAY